MLQQHTTSSARLSPQNSELPSGRVNMRSGCEISPAHTEKRSTKIVYSHDVLTVKKTPKLWTINDVL